MVSIVVPVYKAENVITETIRSVLDQTYTDWELILVDDCSPDKSYEAIKPFLTDERIHYIKLDKNSGAAMARNKGIELAQGKYIAFLDADDKWKSEKLKKQIAFMENGGYAFSCTDYACIDEGGQEKGRIIRCRKKCNYNTCVWLNPIGNSTVILDIEKLGKVYVPDIRKRNDFALWLKILRTKTEYASGLQEVMSYYRVMSNSISSNKTKLIKYQYRLFRDVEHFSVIHAAFQTAMWCVIKVLHIK